MSASSLDNVVHRVIRENRRDIERDRVREKCEYRSLKSNVPHIHVFTLPHLFPDENVLLLIASDIAILVCLCVCVMSE